jgi:hypothetical protein
MTQEKIDKIGELTSEIHSVIEESGDQCVLITSIHNPLVLNCSPSSNLSPEATRLCKELYACLLADSIEKTDPGFHSSWAFHLLNA